MVNDEFTHLMNLLKMGLGSSVLRDLSNECMKLARNDNTVVLFVLGSLFDQLSVDRSERVVSIDETEEFDRELIKLANTIISELRNNKKVTEDKLKEVIMLYFGSGC